MNHKLLPYLSLTLLAAALAGCSATPAIVHTGDRVEFGFTCRLPDGQIAATTSPDSMISDAVKSPFYLPRNGSQTVSLAAGTQPGGTKVERVSFEDEILKRIGGSLAGLREGELSVLELQAERYPAITPKERTVSMAIVRKRQKEMRLSREEYHNRSGKDPEIGQRFVIDPQVPGRVSEVTDTEVVVRFAPEQGKPLTTPFGPVTVNETPSHYELEIKAVHGRLVRTGGMVGRIVDVTKDSFTVDYGHPFGGETLRCDVTVAAVKPAEKKQISPKSLPVPETAPLSATALDPQAEKVFREGMARMLSQSGQAAETTAAALTGDLVTTNYTVTLEDGALVATTLEKIARDPAVQKFTWYREPVSYAPLELVAGKPDVMPGLGEALVGMKAGEKRRITLTPDKAFGVVDSQKIQQLPCRQSFPKSIRMPVDEYVKLFSTVPTMNAEVELLPYFPSRVTEVTGRDVALEFLVADGASFKDSFGTVTVAVTNDKITTILKPTVGAPFPLDDSVGIVTAADDTTFTVDFNHPLVGKTIVLELEAVSISASAREAAAGAGMQCEDTKGVLNCEDTKAVLN